MDGVRSCRLRRHLERSLARVKRYPTISELVKDPYSTDHSEGQEIPPSLRDHAVSSLSG